MNETNLKQQIEKVTNDAKEMAAYWIGTLHEEVIREKLNALLDGMHDLDHEAVEKLLQDLENTLTQAREGIERSDNEG